MERHSDAENQWQLFAETGNIFHYLEYKTQQHACGKGIEQDHANGNDGACATANQGGGSGPDPDPADT